MTGFFLPFEHMGLFFRKFYQIRLFFSLDTRGILPFENTEFSSVSLNTPGFSSVRKYGAFLPLVLATWDVSTDWTQGAFLPFEKTGLFFRKCEQAWFFFRLTKTRISFVSLSTSDFSSVWTQGAFLPFENTGLFFRKFEHIWIFFRLNAWGFSSLSLNTDPFFCFNAGFSSAFFNELLLKAWHALRDVLDNIGSCAFVYSCRLVFLSVY